MRVEQSGEDLRLVDQAGDTVATSAPAVMWDSSRDPARAGEVLPEVAAAVAAGRALSFGEPATAVEAAVTSRTAPLRVAAASGRLAVTPDPTLMADPGLTYPIFLDPAFEKQRKRWAYATSNGENNNATAARVGRQPAPDGGSGERYRSFWDFDVSTLRGKQIKSGTVRIKLDHSWSCGPTWVHLFRTGGITVSSAGRMSWSTRPLPNSSYLDAWQGAANEGGGCGRIYPDVDAEFFGSAVNSDLQYAANQKWTTYTVAVCACNSDGDYESDQERWKRFFTDKAWLEVVFNSVPGTPTGLKVAGQDCGATIGAASPKFRAYYADADGASDSLTGYFEYQQLPSGPVVAKTGESKAGNSNGESGTVTLPEVDGARYQWRVRTRDASNAYSPWTAWCQFTLDVHRPQAPVASRSGWCKGYAGVAYASTKLLKGVGYPLADIRDMLTPEVERVVAGGHSGDISVCHGMAGRLAMLCWFADRLQWPELRTEAKALNTTFVERYHDGGWRCGIGTLPDLPSFLFGLSGWYYSQLMLEDASLELPLCLGDRQDRDGPGVAV
jgi:Lanthionine synthetase C-like protein